MNRFFRIAILIGIGLFHCAGAYAQDSQVLSLEKAVEMALANNRSLAADTYDKQSAGWATAQSVSGYLPKVYFVSTWTRLDQESVDLANQGYELSRQAGFDAEKSAWEDMYGSSIAVTQPIFNGGQEISAILTANALHKERKFNLENRKVGIVRDVKKGYFFVLTAQQTLEVSKESVALAQESLKVAQARFELGQINRSEVLRWEANLATSEGQQIEADNALVAAQVQFNNVLGTALTNSYELEPLTDEQIDQDAASAFSEGAPSFPTGADIDAHPSMRQVDQSVSLAKVDRFSSVGLLLPRANFNYQYQWESNDSMELDGRESWTAGVQLEIPLFQSLGGVFGIGKSQKSVRKAQTSREDFARTLVQQYRLAQLNVFSAKKRVFSSRKGRSFAQENLTLVQGRHKLGMSSNLDLIDAKFTYTSARSEYIRAVGDFYGALADYEFLTATSEK